MAETLDEYLIKLGFKVDDAAQQKFANAVGKSSAKFGVVYNKAVQAAEKVASAVKAFVDGMENVYFASLRTHSSVENIRSLELSMQDFGGSAEGARSSIEGLAGFLRNTPGGEGFLHGMGVQTRKANGDLEDTTELLIGVGHQLAKMDTAHANVYAGLLGIDEKTALALRNGDFEKRFRRSQEHLQKSGYTEASDKARQFGSKMREIGEGLEIIFTKAISPLIDKLLPVMDRIIQYFSDIAEAADGVWGSIGQFIDGLDFEGVDQDLKELFTGVMAIGQALTEAFGPTVRALIQGVVDAFRVLVSMAKIVVHILTGEWSKVLDDLVDVGNHSINVIKDAANAIDTAGGGVDKFVGNVERKGTQSILGDTSNTQQSSQVSQKTDIHVYATDAKSAGQSVAEEQQRVNERMFRDMQGMVY